MAQIQADPLNSTMLQLDDRDIEKQIVKNTQLLAKDQTLAPILPPLYLRIGRVYSLDGSLWEAAVVYRAILWPYPNCAEAESALYGSIVIFEQLKQTDRALAMSQDYLTRYPTGKYADSVGYLRGALAYDAEDFDKAITYFEDCLKNQPNNPQREQIELLIGDVKLRQQKFDEATASYQQYLKDFPKGQFSDQAEYHNALALLFGGKMDDADKAIHAYLLQYPDGASVSDGEYRLAVIKFSAKQYDQVIADCQAWHQKFGKAGPLAEVLSLMADCYALQDKEDEAVKAYIDSYKAAGQNLQALNYSIFAAAKILQSEGKWADISAMFQEFVKDNPDHPTVVSAVSWIGRAEIKLGKVEEGKQFLSATATQYLNDPTTGCHQ